MIRTLGVFLFLFSLESRATDFTETFSTRTRYSSGSAIWNQAVGKVHPTLLVDNYKAGATPLSFDVGDGSHGSFNSTTYANFSQNGDVSGNKIRLDTSTYPILYVTDFTLDSGWVLEPVGSDPLYIYALGSVNIQGEIWCHGENGADSVDTVAGSGGSGRCGGANGGAGGAVSGAGTSGTSINGSVTGGTGGSNSGSGGGGGGSWNTSSGPVAGPSSGGAAGSSSSDPEFTTVAGGAGGGGGAGSGANAGGGGGAGGGTVIIHAVGGVTIGTSPGSTTGFIYAKGGKGGASTLSGGGSGTGGPGGGGGGGSILIFSGGTVTIYNSDGSGASTAAAGSGGGAGVAIGGTGRHWVTGVAYSNPTGGFYTPNEQAPLIVGDWAKFSTSSQNVISQVIDLGNSKPEINGISLSPTSSDFTFEVSGSNDGFVSDDTGWTTSVSALNNKRYLKFRVSIATTNATSPTMVDSATVSYTPFQKTQFDLEAAGCASVEPNGSSSPLDFLPVLLVVVFLFLLKFVTQKQISIKK